MRRRNTGGSEGSLELLLDTICNMFGGIVLIAILLAIVSSTQSRVNRPTTGRTVSDEVYAEQLAVIADLTNQIAVLQGTIAQGIPLVTQDDIDKQRRENQGLEKKVGDLLGAIGELQARIVQQDAEIAVLKKKIDQLQTETQRKRPPSEHVITKSPVFVILKSGRFIPITSMSQSHRAGLDRGFDARHVRTQTTGNRTDITIVAGAGQKIAAGCERQGSMAELLTKVSSQKEFVWFVVYPDSYPEFNYVKNILVGKGFDYNWLPMSAGDPVPPIHTSTDVTHTGQ
jgi:hypothetical protein